MSLDYWYLGEKIIDYWYLREQKSVFGPAEGRKFWGFELKSLKNTVFTRQNTFLEGKLEKISLACGGLIQLNHSEL